MQNIINAVLVLGAMGGIFGAILAVAAKIFYVETDPRVEAVRECLAGANCGACGFPGCDGYAAAVVAGDAEPNCCAPAGAAAAAEIASIMGLDASGAEKMVAFVACSGDKEAAKMFFDYQGPQDCTAAMRFGNKGPKLCQYSCIGMGSCVQACKFGALSVVNGVAVVDREKCVGCMACQKACPKGLIQMVPYSHEALIACSSKDRGPAVMKACSVGCIGCTKCTKMAEAGAIKMDGGLAVMDYSVKCDLQAAVDACPKKIIKKQIVLEEVNV